MLIGQKIHFLKSFIFSPIQYTIVQHITYSMTMRAFCQSDEQSKLFIVNILFKIFEEYLEKVELYSHNSINIFSSGKI